MNKSESSVLSCFGWLGYVLILLTAQSVLGGFVLVKLWEWFVVPTFGLPGISLVPAIGLGMLMSYLTYHRVETNAPKKDTQTIIVDSLSWSIGYPLATLGLAWIVVQFM